EIAGHAELAALLAELRRSAPGTGSPGPAALAVTPPGHQDPPPEEAAPPVVPPGAGPVLAGEDRPGRPEGGVPWSSLRLADLIAAYARLADGEGDEVSVLRRPDGMVLASYPAPPGPAGQFRAGGGMAAALAADGPVDGPSPFDGRPRRYLARHLPGRPVSVVYGRDPSGPRAAWMREALASLALAVATMLVLFWLAALADRRARHQAAARRAEAETVLRHTQRLEALGQIAAGVAHDFRNTVQAVRSGTKLAQKALEAGEPERATRLLDMVAEAAGRGALLTDRMLRMARRGSQPGAVPAAMEPEAALRAAVDLLRRTLPAGYPVRLEVVRDHLPPLVAGEQAELEAALLNLALNARDAMPAGGTIAVRLEGVPPGALPPLGTAAPQAQARISVADSGTGMDPATLARAAEPFFTTKPGSGTGLGLASVRAFAHGAGGMLHLASPGPGRGSTVTLWLPEALPACPGAGARAARTLHRAIPGLAWPRAEAGAVASRALG
ncbi:ATP-binding protein, partial [Siccirubricoccus sp. KC 17139]